MKATVQKWGNSLAVRIPKAFAEETHLAQGTEIEMSISEGVVILAPVVQKPLKLSELLDQVSPENVHSETDWGRPRGRESW